MKNAVQLVAKKELITKLTGASKPAQKLAPLLFVTGKTLEFSALQTKGSRPPLLEMLFDHESFSSSK
jgi:hypothetical protein